MIPTFLRPKVLGALLTSAALAGCAGMRVHSDGMHLAEQGQHEAALQMLREASRLDPTNSEYRIDLLKEVSYLSATLLKRGDALREQGDLDGAALLYNRALQVEPSNERARRNLDTLEGDMRAVRLVAEAERLLKDGQLNAARDKANAALTENPRSEVARRLAATATQQIEQQREAKATRTAARSVLSKPVTLQFRDANLRMVFEALSRTTGLNVILDRDVRADLKTTIFVRDAAVEDTVDMILLQNQLEKRSLNANTLFIYPATAAKQKEYQDLQVRTFQVSNADVKYLQSVLKTVLKIKESSVDERTSTLVIRDTPEAIAVAAKVIAAHDIAEPEVMLEVEVLEVSHARLSNLGIELPDAITVSTPTDATGGLTLGGLRALRRNQLLVTPLSATLNLKLQDTDANLLASPRIRARNKEKARILIGDRVPTITNTVTPVSTGAGVVTGSVQYQDVGLKLEFEPQVYSDQEVGLKINLEVSSIVREIPGPNGSLAYQIGTRNAQTVVRLRDGETQVLGGLISSEDRNTAAKIPGVGHLPVVGRLFGNNNGSGTKTEIVLSITPHIVRAPTVVDASLREVFSGTESSIRERALELEPMGAASMQTGGAGAASPVVPGMTGGGGVGTRASSPAVGNGTAPGTATPAAPAPASRSMRQLLPLMNGARSGQSAPPAPEPVPTPVEPTTPAPPAEPKTLP